MPPVHVYGDGSYDCSADLQRSLDVDVEVRLPPGTYVAKNLTNYTGGRIVGAGVGATILQLPANAGNNASVFKSNGFDALTGTQPVPPADGVHSGGLFNMTLDGNQANQGGATGQSGVRVFGHGMRYEDVEIRNFTGHGFYSEHNSTVGPNSGEKVKAHRMVNVTSHDNGVDGFNWNGPTDSKWFGCVAHSNNTLGGTGYGYNFSTGGGGSGGQQLMGCHSWGTGQTFGYLVGNSFVNLIGCQMEIGATGGVLILANQCSIQGGQVYRNASGASVYGIQVGDGTHTVSGCNIDTLVQNADAGAVNFSNDVGSNSINVNCYQTSGTFVVGTPHATTQCLINGSGGATVPHNHLDLFNANPAVVPLTVRQALTPTVPHQIWSDSTGARLSAIHKGYFMTRRNTIPADADLATNDLALWFDNTNGAGKLMVKAKTANGTVVTGSVTLA